MERSGLKFRRHRIAAFLLCIVLSAGIFAADDDNVFSIPVTFSANTGVNVGFSRKYVDTVVKETATLPEIPFVIDSFDDVLRTETFYFYVQVYVPDRIRISVDEIGPLHGMEDSNEVLHWVNEGESQNLIPGSENPPAGPVITEDGSTDTNKPRVYNIGMNLSIPIAALNEGQKTSTEYSATLSFKVETV